MANQAAGWYPDPSGDITKIRYWDGTIWTDDFAAAPGNTAGAPGFEAGVNQTVAAPGEQPQFIIINTSSTYPADGQASPAYGQTGPAYGEYGEGQYQYAQAPAYVQNDNTQTLRMVAFIFNMISLISVGWTLLPLAWMLPMTIMSWNIYKGKRPNTIAFGVCTLLFLSAVGGILLLVSGEDRQKYPY